MLTGPQTSEYVAAKVLRFLRYSHAIRLTQLVDLAVVDHLQNPRFTLTYILANPGTNTRGELIRYINEKQQVETLTPVYSSANWSEREVWDMFGIYFIGHSDLRRILSDYGFKGYPLRKDFPLTGYLEVFYNERSGLLKHRAVSLAQEYRYMRLNNPWGSYPPVRI